VQLDHGVIRAARHCPHEDHVRGHLVVAMGTLMQLVIKSNDCSVKFRRVARPSRQSRQTRSPHRHATKASLQLERRKRSLTKPMTAPAAAALKAVSFSDSFSE